MANSILNSDDGQVSGSAGLKFTAGDDGVLKIQNNGTDALTLSSAGAVTFDKELSAPLSQPGGFMFRNKLINGNMRISQRYASSSVTVNSSATTYSVDRWLGFGMASAGVFTLNQSTTAPDNFNYSLAATCTTADATISAGDRYFIDQRIEGSNIEDYGFGTSAAKTYCLSFWVQSSLTGTYCVALINSNGTRSYVAEYTINQTDTWEYKTIVILGDTSGTWLTDTGIGITIRFSLATGTTYQTTANTWTAGNFNATANQVNWLSSNSSRFFRITGVQLEEGSAATPFEQRPIGMELSLCQRYCIRFTANPMGIAQGSLSLRQEATPLQTFMRVAPTLAAGASFSVNSGSAGTPGLNRTTQLTGNETTVCVYNSASNWTTNAAVSLTGTFEAEL